MAIAVNNRASPAKAGVQHRAARNWGPAFAGEAYIVERGGASA
jgi:hypothetical protein